MASVTGRDNRRDQDIDDTKAGKEYHEQEGESIGDYNELGDALLPSTGQHGESAFSPVEPNSDSLLEPDDDIG